MCSIVREVGKVNQCNVRKEKKMKQPKAPTRDQKVLLSKEGLIWKNWMVKAEDKISLAVINKESGKVRVILK